MSGSQEEKSPSQLIDARIEGRKTRRAIDVREGESVDQEAFTALIRAAVAPNVS